MQQEGKYIADELEVLGRQILAQCEALPEYILHWPPPLPAGRSLFMLALEAITIIEESIMIPIGGAPFSTPLCSKKSSMDTLVHLQASYEQWIQEVHRFLDILPDSLLDCYVERQALPDLKRNSGKQNTVLIRSCLFHALVEISVIVGRMQTIRQLFLDGERMLEELTERVCSDELMQSA
jgi:hypothetical protein